MQRGWDIQVDLFFASQVSSCWQASLSKNSLDIASYYLHTTARFYHTHCIPYFEIVQRTATSSAMRKRTARSIEH